MARPMPWPAPVTMAILSLSLIKLVRQPLAFAAHFGAGDGRARKVGDVKLVEILPPKSHVRRAAQQNGPAVPGEQKRLSRRAYAPNLVGGIAADVEVSRRVQRQAIREPATTGGIH